MFTAVVEAFKSCPPCDADDVGIWERRDCGCVWDVEVGTYPTLAAARLVAMSKARRKGTTREGRMRGHWYVESSEGVVEAGSR